MLVFRKIKVALEDLLLIRTVFLHKHLFDVVYLTGFQNLNQFFIKSISVLLKKTFTLILHLLSGKTKEK